MAQERLTMRKIAEVLRLKWECGLSNRAVARSCSISHSTVAEYLRRAQEAGLSWPLPADMGEDTLFELLFPKAPPSSSRIIPCPDWSLIHTELRKKSVTLRLLWVEYREAHPDGYGYSQFCALYRGWAKCLKPSMRLSHKGGEKVFVDYAGQTVPIVDPDTGERARLGPAVGTVHHVFDDGRLDRGAEPRARLEARRHDAEEKDLRRAAAHEIGRQDVATDHADR